VPAIKYGVEHETVEKYVRQKQEEGAAIRVYYECGLFVDLAASPAESPAVWPTNFLGKLLEAG
jgi:hypothetical protein